MVQTLKEYLIEPGCEQLMNDPAVLFYRTTELKRMLTVHVGDLFSTGSRNFENKI